MSDKPWGGRFEASLDDLALRFSASVDTDKRLAEQDIMGSLAHIRMLGKQKVVSKQDLQAIVHGLEQIQQDLKANNITWKQSLEDVHMNIEALLTSNIGEAGGRLHTGRSRNDQVATDMRLWTRSACEQTAKLIDRCLHMLLKRASQSVDILLPGYTHLQRAQPVRLAHHLLAWAEMLDRDRGRLVDAAKRLNECPLGSGALATTTFNLDRQYTAKELGFDRPSRNSLDAVSDRDFLIEVTAALSTCMVHLSRISEELILWSSQEFNFVDMGDRLTTGSSMMPQKKNPDMAELIRGKSGRVIGDLVNLIVIQKGLPLTYNRDLQEDKAPVFDAFDTVGDCLRLFEAIMEQIKFNASAMSNALEQGFVNATEVADYLVTKGVAFRAAHEVAGKLVSQAIQTQRTLAQLSLEEYQKANPLFDKGVFAVLDMETAIERRDVEGGPAKKHVQSALKELEQRLNSRKP